MSSPRSVILGQRDLQKLNAMLRARGECDSQLLFDELDSATVMPDHLLPDDVVTMNARVTFVDLDTDGVSVVRLVYPGTARQSGTQVSVLAPVGAALIGLRVGESIEWPLPGGGRRRLKILSLEQDR